MGPGSGSVQQFSWVVETKPNEGGGMVCINGTPGTAPASLD